MRDYFLSALVEVLLQDVPFPLYALEVGRRTLCLFPQLGLYKRTPENDELDVFLNRSLASLRFLLSSSAPSPSTAVLPCGTVACNVLPRILPRMCADWRFLLHSASAVFESSSFFLVKYSLLWDNITYWMSGNTTSNHPVQELRCIIQGATGASKNKVMLNGWRCGSAYTLE